MNKKLAVLIVLLFSSLFFSVANGDVVTHDAFNLNFNAGESNKIVLCIYGDINLTKECPKIKRGKS